MWLFSTSHWKSSSINGPLGGNHDGWAVSWAWLSWLDHRCDNVCLRFLWSSQSMSLHHPHPPRGISLGQGAEMESQAWSWRCCMESIKMHGTVRCSSMVGPLCTGRGTEGEKFNKGNKHFGLLVKVGHWSLWWERFFWGRLDDDAHPVRIGNRHPRPSTLEGDAVTLLLRYTRSEWRETAGLTLFTKQQALFFFFFLKPHLHVYHWCLSVARP